MQYLVPVGEEGSPSNMWPRWESPALLRTSVLCIPCELSALNTKEELLIGAPKLGQPEELLYFCSDENKGSPVTISTKFLFCLNSNIHF